MADKVWKFGELPTSAIQDLIKASANLNYELFELLKEVMGASGAGDDESPDTDTSDLDEDQQQFIDEARALTAEMSALMEHVSALGEQAEEIKNRPSDDA